MESRPLEGRVALVTGGSRGIGRAICALLAARGAKVAFFFASNKSAADETLADITRHGVEGLAFQVDVGNADAVAQGVSAVVAQWGALDIVVNNAGVTRDGLILRMKEEDWDSVVDTNLKGAFLVAKASMKHLLKAKERGRLINIASVVAESGNPGQANYVSAKAGLIGLTKSLALEVASRGVTVNAITPGFIETDMTAGLGEDLTQALLAKIPLSRLGTPDEIAAAVAFLASDAASYITGQVLRVNGGMYM